VLQGFTIEGRILRALSGSIDILCPILICVMCTARVLRCVAVCCGMLRCVAVRLRVLQCVAVFDNGRAILCALSGSMNILCPRMMYVMCTAQVLQCVVECCSMLQRVAAC